MDGGLAGRAVRRGIGGADPALRQAAHRILWSFAVADFVIGGIALPVLVYLGIATTQDVERLAMWRWPSITIAAVMFGWWNRRGVLRSSATTIAEYVAISAERLRRMRMAWRIGWVVLAARSRRLPDLDLEPAVLRRAHALRRRSERFAWGWLALFTLLAIAGLV